MQDYIIQRVTKDNYHMFDDMVYWRINGIERTDKEKLKSKQGDYSSKIAELMHPSFYVYAAQVGQRFIGWITILYTPKLGPWEKGVIYIDELWTSPDFRRKGIAHALMKKAFECMKEKGAVEIRLYTNDDNIAAQELYKKCGLKITGKAVYMQSGENYLYFNQFNT
ncbi:UNVERIFIED_CONTAM: Acetyltransferases [Acetivibrio alkalicellulosi]